MKKKLIVLMVLSGIVRAVYVPTAQLSPILAIPRDVVAGFEKLPVGSKIRFIAPIIHDQYPIDTTELTIQLGALYKNSLLDKSAIMLSAQEAALLYYAYAVFIQKKLLPDLDLTIRENTADIRNLDLDMARITQQIGSLSNDLWGPNQFLPEEQQSLLRNKQSALRSEHERLTGKVLFLKREIREDRTVSAVLQARNAELLQRLTSSHRERLFARGAVIFAWANLAILQHNNGKVDEAKKDMDMALRMITDDLFEDKDFLQDLFTRAKDILGIKNVESRSIYKKFFQTPKSKPRELEK